MPSRHRYRVDVDGQTDRWRGECCSRQQSSAAGVGDQGSGTSTVAGDDGRQDSLGSLSEDPQRIVLPSIYVFQTEPTALCTHACTHTHAAIPHSLP